MDLASRISCWLFFNFWKEHGADETDDDDVDGCCCSQVCLGFERKNMPLNSFMKNQTNGSKKASSGRRSRRFMLSGWWRNNWGNTRINSWTSLAYNRQIVWFVKTILLIIILLFTCYHHDSSSSSRTAAIYTNSTISSSVGLIQNSHNRRCVVCNRWRRSSHDVTCCYYAACFTATTAGTTLMMIGFTVFARWRHHHHFIVVVTIYVIVIDLLLKLTAIGGDRSSRCGCHSCHTTCHSS